MSHQLLLTDICANNHRGNAESVEANKQLAPRKSAISRVIYEWFLASGPATCEEAEEALGLKHQTCSARISELRKQGLLYHVSEMLPGEVLYKPVRRKTRGGSWASVLKAT